MFSKKVFVALLLVAGLFAGCSVEAGSGVNGKSTSDVQVNGRMRIAVGLTPQKSLSRLIVTNEFAVVSLNIFIVNLSSGITNQTINWSVDMSNRTYDLTVGSVGIYKLYVVHNGTNQSGAASVQEEATINIKPLVISLIQIIPGAIGSITVDTLSEQNMTVSEKVEDLLSKMTLEEKVGQMMQVSRGALANDSDITTYFIGSVLSGGGESPSVNDPVDWANMIDGYQRYALNTRLKIPLIYGADGVHGHNNLEGSVIFPHNIGMGATRDLDLATRAARITALEMAATGVKWTFAPCIAVARDIRWGRTYESFGESPQLVSDMGTAEIMGFQGTNLFDTSSIIATAKHYVADGGTLNGQNAGDAEISEAELRSIHLYPYLSAVSNSVGSVMVSYSSWNGVMMHVNGYLISNVLKTELGFKGFVVSDWDGLSYVPGNFSQRLASGINAGIDMVMMSGLNYVQFFNTVIGLVQNNTISQDRIDDAVRRILTAKYNLGLFDHPLADRSYAASIGSPEHRLVAREAVRKSLVLLKNSNNILPLSKAILHIHVAGLLADNIGGQCGGWTISWQGMLGNTTTGTTILQGIRQAVSANTAVTYSTDGSGAIGSDVGIVVVGETPYAEGYGDKTDLSLSTDDLNTINNLKSTGIPVITIIISGRPMIITSQIPGWDACIAAWLPGTEGEGIADVLFGDYAPTGKLPQTWPISMSVIPVHQGDSSSNYLFPFGFGLSY